MRGAMISMSSRESVETVGSRIEAASVAHGFSVLHIHDLAAKLRERGEEFDGECRVYEVCEAHRAARVLWIDPSASVALPCRISVYSAADGTTRAVTLKPAAFAELLDVPAIAEVAPEIEAWLREILEYAVGD